MEKRAYEAPEAEALRIEFESLICQSGQAGVLDYSWIIVPEE